MSTYAQDERVALCDLLVAVGPDQATLCEGWTTRDLAAHLVVRERRPDAALGIIAAPLARHGEQVRMGVAAAPWPDLVEQVRGGPPHWSPMGLGPIDEAANTMEMFIHHEDVRRAADGWEPRELEPELAEKLWKLTSRMAKLMMRKAPCGVALALPDGTTAVVKKGEPLVEVRGEAGELALFAYGRQDHARVELSGPDDAVAALRQASFGV